METVAGWFLVMLVQGSDFGVIMGKDGYKSRDACEVQKQVQIIVANRLRAEIKEKTSYLCVALPVGTSIRKEGA